MCSFILSVDCGTSAVRPGATLTGKKIMHPAFAAAGRAKGLEVWRIEVRDKIDLKSFKTRSFRGCFLRIHSMTNRLFRT